MQKLFEFLRMGKGEECANTSPSRFLGSFLVGIVFFSALAAYGLPLQVFAQTPPASTPAAPAATPAPPAGAPSAGTPATPAAGTVNPKTGILVTGNKALDTAAQAGLAAAQLITGDPAAALKTAAPVAAPIATGLADTFLHFTLEPLCWAIFSISYLILAVAGVLFNWTVIRTVFQFASYFGNSSGMLLAWGILRDVGNIVLLFGFIFMGVATILNIDKYSARKTLPGLIIFAVLLNFSLFAADLVIDTANVFSSSLAAQAGQNCAQSSSATTCAEVGISGNVLKMVGVTSLLAAPLPGTDPINHIETYLVLSLFVITVAMVLLAGAIMLGIRAVTLMFLVVASPIGFAGMAIPALQPLARDWWKRLLSQSFFAPVYLVLILISIKIVSAFGAGISLVGALTTAGGSAVLVFVIAIAFLLASLMVAKKLGAGGADFATKTAGGLTYGALGFVGRRTLGRASAVTAQSIRNSKFGETEFGRFTAGIADRGAKNSFDLRSSKGFGLVAKGFSVDVGTPNKVAAHGYHGIEEKALKERVDYAKSLKGTRLETEEEFAQRVAQAEAALATEQTVATTAVAAAEAARATAELAQTEAQARVTTQQGIVGVLRAAAARNPNDIGTQQRLLEEQGKLAGHERDLSQASQNLQARTTSLAAARKVETETSKKVVNLERGKITERERQENYADNIEHRSSIPGWPQDLDPTAAGHANHAAYGAIRTYAKKTPLERQVAALQEGVDKATEKGDEHASEAHKDSAPVPTPSGGNAHGGGGGH